MKGYPRHINTKDDLLTAMEINPGRAKAWIQSAITYREGWHVTVSLESESEGATDDTHRVVDQGDEDRGPDWYQQEWGPLPGNRLERIGLTLEEAEAML